MTSTITVKHKVPNGLRKLTLATERCALDSFDFVRDGVTVLKVPRDIVAKLSILRSLPVDEEVDMVEVKEVKDMVERWLHLKMPLCSKYIIRHLIVRNSHASRGLMTRKQLPVQKPGQYFHIDQEHSDLVNIWLPLTSEPLTDFQLGFIRYENQLMDATGLKQMYKENFTLKECEKQACVVYPAILKLGDAIVFRSGGKHAVVHGSFRFDAREKQTDLPRMSMEFRCQYKDPIDGFGPQQKTAH